MTMEQIGLALGIVGGYLIGLFQPEWSKWIKNKV